MSKSLGFTGTHKTSLTLLQHTSLSTLLGQLKKTGYKEFHHGDAEHADTEAALIATRWGYRTIAHPCDKIERSPSVRRLETFPPLERNQHIVDASEIMIACPRLFKEELRSGTWMTIRYARRMKKPLVIVWPDGVLEQELVGSGNLYE